MPIFTIFEILAVFWCFLSLNCVFLFHNFGHLPVCCCFFFLQLQGTQPPSQKVDKDSADTAMLMTVKMMISFTLQFKILFQWYFGVMYHLLYFSCSQICHYDAYYHSYKDPSVPNPLTKRRERLLRYRINDYKGCF